MITEAQDGMRIDRAIADLLTDISRSRIQKAIDNQHCMLNDQVIKQRKTTVKTGDKICLSLATEINTTHQPQALPLAIIFEDEDLFVINKPKNLVAHPGAGQPDHTLLNAVLAKLPSNEKLPQAGLIHRLDKDTTGLLIIAKNEASYYKLNALMAKRVIKREYIALVKGVVHTQGTIDEPLARSTTNRQKFTTHPNGKRAITHYQVLERFPHHTLLKVKLETGRTHQIRVHMQSINHPIVGDKLYNRQTQMKKHLLNEATLNTLYHFPRQALHAAYLTFPHPIHNETIALKCPLPEDFEALITALRSSP